MIFLIKVAYLFCIELLELYNYQSSTLAKNITNRLNEKIFSIN